MKEKTQNKREWVKNVAIVFLLILLILTFFSNTILNYSLPEVSAQYVENGTITAKIRGQGVIESSDLYNVKIKQMRKVDSIEVKTGQYVEEGTILCVLSNEDSTELEAAKDALLLAQRDLTSAENAYTMAIIKSDVNASSAGTIESTEAYLTKINAAKEAVDKAKNELEAEEKKVEEISQRITALETQIQISGSETADTSNEQAAVNAAKYKRDQLYIHLNELNNRKEGIQNEMKKIKDNTPEGQEPDYQSLPGQLAETEAAIISATTDYNNADIEFQYASATLENKVNSFNNSGTMASLNAQLSNARAELVNEQSMVDKRTEILKINQDNYDKLLNNIDSSFALYDLQVAIEDKRIALQKAEDKVKKLEAQEDGINVVAPISGTISDILIKSGEDTPDDGVVMTMQPKGKGYTMTMSVTNEQAKRLSVGDKAELVNSWRYSDMDITISSIKPDKNNPGKGKVITFDISGEDIAVGQSISISVGQKSSNYDTIVPNSAIHQDGDGKFILIVEQKSSPIGTRYYASKVQVEVLASDDTRSAISGALTGSEFVITTSNKPVDKNTQIRLAD